jgi:hypothetical protein
MTIRALLLVVAALVAAPAAFADGGPMYSLQGGGGVAGPDGIRFISVPTNSGDTTLIVLRHGTVFGWQSLVGSYGIPMITNRDSGGVSRDGTSLVLQSTAYFGDPNATTTRFLVLDTRTLRTENGFFLKGTFAFDALSPDGKRLFLTQHVDANNASRYVVRAYDLTRDRLLPGRIADRTQKSWVMQGDALTRTTSPGGRWVYTLYDNYGGYPFIHALDTVRGVAHCIGLPWKSTTDQNGLMNVRLTLHGSRLAVHWLSGRSWLDVDTHTWRVTPVSGGSGFPWLWTGIGAGAAAVLLLLFVRRPGLAKGTLSVRPV